MENDAGEAEPVLQYSSDGKLHGLMCTELAKFVDRIEQVFPALESARPGCMSGIEALCALNTAIKRAKLLLQHCAESSMLFLAISGEEILLRFERVRKSLDHSLSKIQTMVPQPLAAQVLDIISGLRDVKFVLESSEEECGKLLLSLITRDGSICHSEEASECKVFHVVATKLDITSCKAVLIEKRCIRKLLDKVHHTGSRKEMILKHLLCLLKKYGRFGRPEHSENVNSRRNGSLTSVESACENSIGENHVENLVQRSDVSCVSSEAQANECSPESPPEEFICPLSLKLMSDPVVIASGKTYERIWIEKWFNDGHDTCPKTQKQLSHFSVTPNSCVKDLISKWCRKHDITIADPSSQSTPPAFSSWRLSDSSPVSSFNISSNSMPTPLDSSPADYITESDVSNVSINSGLSNCLDSPNLKNIENFKYSHGQVFLWIDDSGSGSCQSFANFSQEMYLNFLCKLASLPEESQGKAVEDVKTYLKDNGDAYHSMQSNGFIEALMRFLMDARDQSNINAQSIGLQILLSFIANSREETSLQEISFDLLGSFVEPSSKLCEDALAIMCMMSRQSDCRHKILASSALPSVIRILNSQVEDHVILAVKILSELSSDGGLEIAVLESGCISKLAQLLGNKRLAGNCLRILRNLCETEHSRVSVAETNGCVVAVAELLDNDSTDDQGHAAEILLSLCSYSREYCHLVMDEGVIPSLVSISINGNIGGKESAMKLLHLLRDIRDDGHPDSLQTVALSNSKLSQGTSKCIQGKQSSYAFLKKKINIFSKYRISGSLLKVQTK